MSSISTRWTGVALGVLGLAACDPAPPPSPYSITLNEPAPDSNPHFEFDVSADVTEGFKLVESACDPNDYDVDPDYIAIVNNWNPEDCLDADGEPPDDEGNIQFFVDGIFHAYSTQKDFHVDLTPKISFAVWDYQYDENNQPVDVDGDNCADLFYQCSMWFPDDNLHYASRMYEEAMYYTAADLVYPVATTEDQDPDACPAPQLLTSDTLEPLDPQPPVWDIFNYVYAMPPWALFDYSGGGNIQDDGTVHHLFYAELHHNDHSVVYGAARVPITTQGFDENDMATLPGEGTQVWCGYNPLIE